MDASLALKGWGLLVSVNDQGTSRRVVDFSAENQVFSVSSDKVTVFGYAQQAQDLELPPDKIPEYLLGLPRDKFIEDGDREVPETEEIETLVDGAWTRVERFDVAPIEPFDWLLCDQCPTQLSDVQSYCEPCAGAVVTEVMPPAPPTWPSVCGPKPPDQVYCDAWDAELSDWGTDCSDYGSAPSDAVLLSGPLSAIPAGTAVLLPEHQDPYDASGVPAGHGLRLFGACASGVTITNLDPGAVSYVEDVTAHLTTGGSATFDAVDSVLMGDLTLDEGALTDVWLEGKLSATGSATVSGSRVGFVETSTGIEVFSETNLVVEASMIEGRVISEDGHRRLRLHDVAIDTWVRPGIGSLPVRAETEVNTIALRVSSTGVATGSSGIFAFAGTRMTDVSILADDGIQIVIARRYAPESGPFIVERAEIEGGNTAIAVFQGSELTDLTLRHQMNTGVRVLSEIEGTPTTTVARVLGIGIDGGPTRAIVHVKGDLDNDRQVELPIRARVMDVRARYGQHAVLIEGDKAPAHFVGERISGEGFVCQSIRIESRGTTVLRDAELVSAFSRSEGCPVDLSSGSGVFIVNIDPNLTTDDPLLSVELSNVRIVGTPDDHEDSVGLELLGFADMSIERLEFESVGKGFRARPEAWSELRAKMISVPRPYDRTLLEQ